MARRQYTVLLGLVAALLCVDIAVRLQKGGIAPQHGVELRKATAAVQPPDAAAPLSAATPSCAVATSSCAAAPTCPPPAKSGDPAAPRGVVALGGRTNGVLPLSAPRRRCGQSTPGMWMGNERPFYWKVGDPDCDYSVSSQWDFLTRFAGKRLLVIGDSTTRELTWDLMVRVTVCARDASVVCTGDWGRETS